MNKNIITFDYAKLFFAICVVALHTQAFSCISPVFDNYLAKMLYCLAVPFFFFVSGYLLHDNLSFSKDDVFVIKKRIARLLKPYILFSIINILLYIIKSSLYDGDSFNHIALKIIQSIIFYPFGSLWFIWAMIIALLLLVPFIIKNKLKLAVIFGFFLYIPLLFANSYYGLISGTFIQKSVDFYLKYCVSARNGLFEGFVYVGGGILFADIYKKRLIHKKIPLFACLVVTASFIVLNCIEVLFADKYIKFVDGGCIYLCHLIVVPSIVFSLLKINDLINYKLNTVIIRNLSTGVYLTQRPLITIISLIELSFMFSINTILNFGLVLIISIATCLLIYKNRSNDLVCYFK